MVSARNAEAVRAMVDVQFKDVDGLIPYARNSRTHSKSQISQLAASLEEFGFTNPVLADERGIVAGHGRVLAAQMLYTQGHSLRLPNGAGIPKNCVPVIDVSGWSDAKRRAYVIADNRLAENAAWDVELLKLEVSDLTSLSYDLSLTGFDAGAIDALFKTEEGSAAEADDEPALDEPEAPTVIACPKCAHQFSVLEEKPAKKKRKAA